MWPSEPSFPHESWGDAMRPHQKLLSEIWANIESCTPDPAEVTPAPDRVFAAMRMPISSVTVVILGQDPYPAQGVATGLAFQSSAETASIPASLRNIGIEYEHDLGRAFTPTTMDSWASQGVLLLNTILTTRVGQSLAHRDAGWQEYTALVLSSVLRVNPQVVAVLWGRQAQMLQGLFTGSRVVASAHPSPLSARRGFFGSRPFSNVNSALADIDRAPIVW
jgi:uracil-DNA glycosylase